MTTKKAPKKEAAKQPKEKTQSFTAKAVNTKQAVTKATKKTSKDTKLPEKVVGTLVNKVRFDVDFTELDKASEAVRVLTEQVVALNNQTSDYAKRLDAAEKALANAKVVENHLNDILFERSDQIKDLEEVEDYYKAQIDVWNSLSLVGRLRVAATNKLPHDEYSSGE